MTRHLERAYTVLALVTAVLYLLVPALAPALILLMVVATVAAYLYGVHRFRPRRRLPWWLLAVGVAAFALSAFVGAYQPTFPSAADAVWFGVSFPAILVGFLGLSRSGATLRDWAGMIDSLILTAGAGFVAWVYLINPYLTDPALTGLQKLVSVAYPLGDVLLLAMLVRLALVARRSRNLVLLLISGTALLVSDILFSFERLNGGWSAGGVIDMGWLIFIVAGGLGALSPSMTVLTEPRLVSGTNEFKTRRLVLGTASLIAPAVLFAEALNGPVVNGLLISIVAATLFCLSLGRMSVIASGLRHTAAWERGLRRACEALLSETEVDGVERVVRTAVGDLLGPDTRHRTLLVRYAGEPGAPNTDAVRICDVTDLPDDLAGELSGFDLVLHCPLSVAGSRVGDLYVAADELSLVALHEAARVLAGQVASMIDRIALNREINRRESEAYFRTLVLNATDVILIVGPADRVSYASPSARNLFGSESVVGASLDDLIEPATTSAEPGGAALWVAHRPGAAPAEVEVTVRDLRDEPTVGGRVLTLRDVTDRRRLERELLDRAYLDPLTGLGNRLRFHDATKAAVSAAALTGRSAGILLVNIEDFRTVNDAMGHDAGDELLIELGRRLSRVNAAYGSVSRLSGDEFGLVVASAHDVTEIEGLAAQVLEECSGPFSVGGPGRASVINIQPRVGVSTTADAGDHHDLLAQADVALGIARTANPRWRRYEGSMHAQVLSRMQLRVDLGQAIVDNEFILYFQPIVDLTSGRPLGVEALVRWQHPRRGLVAPVEFIEIAEESGLIVPLGDWVLHNAVAAAVRFGRISQGEPPYVSVNVSVRQFRSAGFVERVLSELARAGLPAGLLTIEITESLLLGDDDQIQESLRSLRTAGVKVSIDDFGTGYSSLSYLHRVDIDTLKLDKSFVDTIASSKKQYDLVRGLIQLAGTLELDVVAEGVETEEHRQLLADAGCAHGQGYLFARPLTEDAVSEGLRTGKITGAVVTVAA
jgi:diguanylate cyclase (GGDEF)-like protein